MKKQFTILLILTFVLGLVPVNFSEAITQSQISAEVQIVCPDNYGNWYSGSGTIIDPKGIILTNKHVVSDQYGGIIKTCFIGFTESINQEPNFGTETNPNLAEVKYYTTASDMDTAILYLENPTNKSYTYIDIWNSDSNTLQFGHKIEAIGFPSIGGSTITYTSGDFSGFGSASDGTQNYIKATTPLEHGNSGGAAYNPTGQFIGIPTMVVAGTLNSLSYILSVNSITSWLSGILGNNYRQEVIEQKPIIETPRVNIQNDITPPDLTKLKINLSDWGSISNIAYIAFNENTGKQLDKDEFDNVWLKRIDQERIITDKQKVIQLVIDSEILEEFDKGSGLSSIYYKYSDSLENLSVLQEQEYIFQKTGQDFENITNKITFPDKEALYYISLRFKDGSGNISDNYILSYQYLKEHFKSLNNIKFYSDPNYSYIIGDYDFDLINSESNFKYCVTKHKNLYLQWSYSSKYEGAIARSFPTDMWKLTASDATNNKNLSVIKNNRYSVKGLNNAKENNEYYGTNICENSNDTWCHTTGKVSSFLVKPYLGNESSLFLEGKNIAIKFAYNPNFSKDILCGDADMSRLNNFNQPMYVLKEGNKLLNTNTNLEINNSLATRLKGYILLQVEANGESFYVNPKDNKRYYMANGNEAYRIMRYLGVGITDADLNKVKTNKSFAKQHSGKIFLQVEAHGEAFYIDFDGNAHYLKDGSAAYTIMRDLGLGITNSDLSKIPEGSL